MKVSVVALRVAIAVSLAACVPDPYSQENGHTTNIQVPQPYPTDVYVHGPAVYVPAVVYVPAEQPVYAPPQQPVYAPPQYVQVQASYSSVLQTESVSVSRGTCDRGLLAPPDPSNPFGAAGPLVAGDIHVGMSPVDDGCVGLALEFARNNQAVVWQNPANGAQYQVTPIDAYQQNGLQCRQYTTVATYNGIVRTVNARACKLPSGSWQLQI